MNVRCFDDEELLDLIEGRRSFDAEVEEHLSRCADCSAVFSAGARAGATLRDGVAYVPPQDEPAWEELGQGVTIAGTYELDRFVGMGATGVVWAAHRSDGSRVALKISRDRDPELWKRFEREARVTSRIVHPNVIRIFDVVPAAATRGPCLVQELLVGRSLDARLTEGPAPSIASIAAILVPIARALAAAHACGIVHRDLKPQNVMLEADRVVVLDFGIAKLLSSWGPHTQLTRPGSVLGTLQYMAPEQVFGDRDVDARADVWSIGALAFRLLTGAPLIDETKLGGIAKLFLRGDVPTMARHLPSLPADVRDLLRAALTIPKEKRLADLIAFEEVFARYASRAP